MGSQFWENYQDDFEDWSIDMFKDCEKEVINCLRDTLARRGTKEEIQTQIEYGGGFLGNYRPSLAQISAVPTQADKDIKVEPFQNYETQNMGPQQTTRNTISQSDHGQPILEKWVQNPATEIPASKIEGEAYKNDDNPDPPYGF
ncbi:hypothetical protein GcM3_131022, partial [Golovinomyces cichoracearum]